MKQAFATEFGDQVVLKLKIISPEPSQVQQNQIKGKEIQEFKILSPLLLVKVV